MLRAAFVGACPFPVPQGSQVYLAESARTLQSCGHDVRLITYGHGLGPDPDDLRVVRCPRVPGDSFTKAGPAAAKLWLDPLLALTIRSTLRREAVEVVFAHNYEGLIASLAGAIGLHTPVIYMPHNALADELPYYFGGAGWSAAAGRWMDRTFPRRAQAVAAPHERLADYLIGLGCDPKRTAVIPPPVDAAPFLEPELRGDAPSVLYLGNLDAYQNLPLLEEALQQVRAQRPETPLHVLTHAAAATLPGAEVIRLGSFADLPAALARDAVVAVPRVSWSGFPMKELNAMAAGLPVVACQSAAGTVRDGIDGLLVPDGDARAFAGALCRLLDDSALRERMGRSARERARTLHSHAVVGHKLEALALQTLEAD
ncbi:MAG: glycosyltransferase [Candidatus Hydrogenedens sp.]|nr:glycosyltransferase [Candidatus Hydrogenedens sp.]